MAIKWIETDLESLKKMVTTRNKFFKLFQKIQKWDDKNLLLPDEIRKELNGIIKNGK